MYGDYSRWTFDPDNNHAAVLVQQGQPLTDADWNEQAMIAAEAVRSVVQEIYGELATFTGKKQDPQNSKPFEVADQKITFASPFVYIQGVRSKVTLSLRKAKSLELEIIDKKLLSQTLDKPDYQVFLEATPIILDRFSPEIADSAIPTGEPLRLQFQATIGLATPTDWEALAKRVKLKQEHRLIVESRSSSSTRYRVQVLRVGAGDQSEIQLGWAVADSNLAIPVVAQNNPGGSDPRLLIVDGAARSRLKAFRKGQFVSIAAPSPAILPSSETTALYEITDLDSTHGQIRLTTAIPSSESVTHIFVWKGVVSIKKASVSDRASKVKIFQHAGTTAYLQLEKKDPEIETSDNLQHGDYWTFEVRGSTTPLQRFSPRSSYLAPLAKITGGPDAPKFALSPAPMAPPAPPPVPPVAPPGMGRLGPTQNSPGPPLPFESSIGPAPAIAFDLTLRHLAASIKTPQLKQWLHSATLPEVWGLGLTRLRDKLLSCFPKPPADNAQFEEDLRRVIQDSDIIAQRLDYRGTENDSQFA